MEQTESRRRSRGEREYRSLDEYKRRFYPVQPDEAAARLDDPYALGVQVASQSLSRYKHLLVKKQPRTHANA